MGWALVALGLGGAGALWATGPAVCDTGWVFRFLVGYLAAWCCYVAAAVAAGRARRLPRWALVWIVAAGIAMRFVCLARTPPLSTDVWRYLWDGRVVNAGINPYRHPPAAADPGAGYPDTAEVRALRALRDGNWRAINYKPVPTIYPPLAEGLFAGLAGVRGRDAAAFWVTFTLFDVGSILVLIALLRRTGRRPERVIWYAWCPLVVTEVTAGAHVDAVGLFLLLAAFWLAARRQGRPGVGSGLALGAAVMTKGYAVLAAPLFVKRGGWRALAAAAVVCAVALLPFAGAGRQVLAGLRAYLEGWDTNASVFILLDRWLEGVSPDHFILTRRVTMAAVALVLVGLVWRQKPGMAWLLGGSFAAIGAQLAIGAPTLPWYVIWVVPALCWWEIPALALFTLTVSAQYYARWLYPLEDQAARDALLWAGYGPVYALLVGQAMWWAVRRRRSAPSRSP